MNGTPPAAGGLRLAPAHVIDTEGETQERLGHVTLVR